MNAVKAITKHKHAFNRTVASWYLLGHLHEAAGLPVVSATEERTRPVYPNHYQTPPLSASAEQAKEWSRRLAAYLFARRAHVLPEAITRHATSSRVARDIARSWIAFLRRCGGYQLEG